MKFAQSFSVAVIAAVASAQQYREGSETRGSNMDFGRGQRQEYLQFMSQFNKKPLTTGEFEHRLGNFIDSERAVEEINQ